MNILENNADYLINSLDQEDYLFYVYDRAINAGAKLSDLVETRSSFNRLMAMYQEPVSCSPLIPRNYHNFSHISQGVRDIVDVEVLCECTEDAINNVLLAWFYHDCVYVLNPATGTNEEDSAKFALNELLQMGFSGERAGRIYDLVLWTKHKVNPPENDYEANLIVDIDLQRISACPVEAFFMSTETVREEFGFLSDKEWIEGRIKFWKSFLKLKGNRVFRTSHFEHLNKIAVDNINKEIYSLEKSNFRKGDSSDEK